MPTKTHPDPMILIQPDGDAIRFNVYGMDAPALLVLLRRCLIFVAAEHAGLATIDAVIPPQAAIAANGHSPETVPATRVLAGDAPPPRGKPGPKPGFKKARVAVDPDDLLAGADHPQD